MKQTTIIKDRVEIFKDFAINLLYYIYNNYIDKESLSDDIDIKNHFNWCFNLVCNEFKEEGIDFSTNTELWEYYFSYYYNQFYKIKGNPTQDVKFNYYENFWKDIFEINKPKNKNMVNLLIEIYMISNKSIDNEKKLVNVM